MGVQAGARRWTIETEGYGRAEAAGHLMAGGGRRAWDPGSSTGQQPTEEASQIRHGMKQVLNR